MDEIKIEELRQNYLQCLEASLPQRAKGVPYLKIASPFLMIWLFSMLFILPPLGIIFRWELLYEHEGLFFLIFFPITYLFFYGPEYYYHQIKRNKRWAKKHYPHIYKQIYSFKEKTKKDRMIIGPPLLKVEGQGYFFGLYARQAWWEQQATLTGFFVLTEEGQLVESEEIFTKVFLTYNYSLIGAVSGQGSANERFVLKENMKVYVPRAEKILKKLKGYFEENNVLYNLEKLLEYIPGLYSAAQDALFFFDGREKYRKSMGYSFGHEFFYEDAVQEMDMRQAFCKYMLAAHYVTLNNVRVFSARLIDQIQQDIGGWQKPIVLKSLKKIWELAFTLSTLIDRMAQQGIPSEDDRKLFREKTAYVKTVKEERAANKLPKSVNR